MGNQYSVLVLTPVGMYVDSVEIHEKKNGENDLRKGEKTNEDP